jgi:phage-related baseplate assembly protein
MTNVHRKRKMAKGARRAQEAKSVGLAVKEAERLVSLTDQLNAQRFAVVKALRQAGRQSPDLEKDQSVIRVGRAIGDLHDSFAQANSGAKGVVSLLKIVNARLGRS